MKGCRRISVALGKWSGEKKRREKTTTILKERIVPSRERSLFQ